MDKKFCVWNLKRTHQDDPESEPVVLRRGITTIGRGVKNSLRCQNELASRNHCEIQLLDSGLIFVKDLKSLNGTYLGSSKILPERYVSLSHGDIIGIGVETTDIEKGAMCIFHLTQQVLDTDELESRRGDDGVVPLNGQPCEDSTSYSNCVNSEKTANANIDDSSMDIVVSPEPIILVNQPHSNINKDHGLAITSNSMGNKTKIDRSLNKDTVSKQQSNVDISKTGSDSLSHENNKNNDLDSNLSRNPNSTINITQPSKFDSPLTPAETKFTRTEMNSRTQPQDTLCKTKQGTQCSKADLIEPEIGGDLDKLDENNLSSTKTLNSTTHSLLSPLPPQDLTANDKSMVTKNTLNYNLPVEKSSQSKSPKVKETDDPSTPTHLSNECFSAGKKEIGSDICGLENLKSDDSGTVSYTRTNTNDLVSSIQQQSFCRGPNKNVSDIDNTINSIFKRRLSHDSPNHKNPPETKNMTSSVLERCDDDDSISLIDCSEKLLHPKKIDEKRKSKSLDDQDISILTGKVNSSVPESFTIVDDDDDDDMIIIDDDLLPCSQMFDIKTEVIKNTAEDSKTEKVKSLVSESFTIDDDDDITIIDDDDLPCSQMFDIKNEAIENTVEDSDIPVIDITDEDDISEADSSDEWFLRLSQCEPLNIDTLKDDYDLDSENSYVDCFESEAKESNVIERIFDTVENPTSEVPINQNPLEFNMDVCTASEELEPENNHAVKEKLQKADSWLKQKSVDINLNKTCSYGPNSNNKRKHDGSELITAVNHLDNQHVPSKKIKQTHSNDAPSPTNNIAGAGDVHKMTIKQKVIDESLPSCEKKSDVLNKVQDVNLSEPTTDPQTPAWKYFIDKLLIVSNNWDASKGCARTPCDEGDTKGITANTSIPLNEAHNFTGQEHFESTASTSVSNNLNTTPKETIQICNEIPEESKLMNKTVNDSSLSKTKKHSHRSSKHRSVQDTELDSIQKKISEKYKKQPTPVVGAKALTGKTKKRQSRDHNENTEIAQNGVEASKSKSWLSKGVIHKSNAFPSTADKKAHRKSKLSEIASKTKVQQPINANTKIVKPPKNSIKITHKNRNEMFLDHLVSSDNSSKVEKSATVYGESKQNNGLLQFKIPRRNVIKDDKKESETLNEGGNKQCQTTSVANESFIMETANISEIENVIQQQSNVDLSKTIGSMNCDINNVPAGKNTDTTTGFTAKQNEQAHRELECEANDKSHHVISVVGHLKPIIKVPNSTLNNKIKKTVRFHHGDENKLIVKIRYIEIAEGSSLKPITKSIARKEPPPQRQYNLNNATQMPVSDYAEETLYQICQWNTVWFQEKNKVKGEPPVFKGQIYHLQTSFISYSDYRKSFCPLMLYQLWANLARHHDQIQNNKPFIIDIQRIANKPVTNVFFSKDGETKTLCRLECQILLDKSNQSWCPRKGDLAVLDLKKKSPNGESLRRRILGYIFFCSNVRAISSHSAISPMLRAKIVDASLVMDLSVYIREDRWKIDTTQESRIAVLKNIIPEMRLFKALDCLSTSSMLDIICKPGSNNLKVPPRLGIEKSTRQAINHLNESQTKAVTNVVSACLANRNMIHFIHGPPGCGKSEVIISIIQMIVLAHINKELTEPPQILLCAPSNAAIDDIFLRLMEHRNKFKNRPIKMVRIGRTDVAHKNVRSMTLDFLVDKDLKKRRDILEDEESRQIELKTLEAKRNQLSYQLENLGLKKNDGTFIRNIEMKLAETIKHMKELEKGKKEKAFEGKELREKKRERELLLLGGANVIASTLSSCYNGQMEAAQANKKLRLTCCIVDEATQCSEPDLLIPLMLGVRQLVLVGDPLQLPATVLSSTAKEHGLDRSLFARHQDWWLQNNPEGFPKPQYHFLDTQYRMHPDIAKWPSQYFYKSSIKNHNSLEARSSSHPLLPYVILSHSFTQTNHEECNYEEVTLVELLVQAINESGLSKRKTIGVVTPYSRQRDLLRRTLVADIDVGTVDSFQGQERDIIIMSCVRTQGVGFMSGIERLNVALTRARYSLIVCGNFKSLQGDSTWASLLQDAMVRGVLKTVMTAYRTEDLLNLILKSK